MVRHTARRRHQTLSVKYMERVVCLPTNESGRVEVYVQPFPNPGRKIQISSKGGAQARWRPDGQELFYVALDGT